jgi:hypothetical protein
MSKQSGPADGAREGVLALDRRHHAGERRVLAITPRVDIGRKLESKSFIFLHFFITFIEPQGASHGDQPSPQFIIFHFRALCSRHWQHGVVRLNPAPPDLEELAVVLGDPVGLQLLGVAAQVEFESKY